MLHTNLGKIGAHQTDSEEQASSPRQNEEADITQSEQNLYRLECIIDTLDRLSDSMIDDPITANAIIAVHQSLCEIHHDFKQQLLPDIA